MKNARFGLVCALVLAVAGFLFLALGLVLPLRAFELVAWGLGSLGAAAYFETRALAHVEKPAPRGDGLAWTRDPRTWGPG